MHSARKCYNITKVVCLSVCTHLNLTGAKCARHTFQRKLRRKYAALMKRLSFRHRRIRF